MNGDTPTQTVSVPQEPLALPSMWTMPSQIIDQILDPYIVIERFRRNLLGQMFSQDERKWVDLGKRSLNDKGIREVISVLDSYVNRNTLLSNLDDEEIYKLTMSLNKELNTLFYMGWDKFEIDVSDISLLVLRICDMCFLALKQANNKALLDALTKSYSVREMKGLPEEKKGLSLNPFK
jgi:hypothetical protein